MLFFFLFNSFFFFFNDTATTEIYTLSLHDALPIRRTASPPSCAGIPLRTRRNTPGGPASSAPPLRSPRFPVDLPLSSLQDITHSPPQTPKCDHPAASDGGNTRDEAPDQVGAVGRTDFPCRLAHRKAGAFGQPGRYFLGIRPQSMLPLAARASCCGVHHSLGASRRPVSYFAENL